MNPSGKRSVRVSILILVVLWADLIRNLSFHWSTNPQYAFGWTVPLLSLLLLWEGWITRPVASQPAPGPALLGVAGLCAVGLLPTRIIMEATPDWRFAHWALAFEVVGLTLSVIYLACGRLWLRHFAFPILFILVAVPWPVKFEQPFIAMLTEWVASLTVNGLNLCDVPALRKGNLIEVSTGVVGVEEACSGVRSFQATLMAALFLGQLWAFGKGMRVVLLGTGVALAFGCNVVRAWLLAFVAEKKGLHAIDQWHDPAGFTILGITFLGLLALALYLRPRASRSLAPPDRAASAGLPSWVAVGLAVAGLSAFAGTEAWYRSGNLAQATWWFIERPTGRREYSEPPIPEATSKWIGYDEGWNARWKEDDGSDWTVYFFRWMPGLATSRITARWHNPEYCMRGAGFELKTQSKPSRVKVGDIELVFKVYRFEMGGTPIHVFFCVWEDRNLEGEEVKPGEEWTLESRWEVVRQRKRNLGQQMLQVWIQGIEDDQKARESFERHLPQLVRRDPDMNGRKLDK